MKPRYALAGGLVVLGLALVARAQAPAGGTQFSDDFREVPKDRYETQGPVAWKAGRVELREGGMIIRKIESGPFIAMTARLELPAPEREGNRALTRLAFAYRTGTVVTAILDRTRRGGRILGTITVERF